MNQKAVPSLQEKCMHDARVYVITHQLVVISYRRNHCLWGC